MAARIVKVESGEIKLAIDRSSIVLWTPCFLDDVGMTAGQARLLAAALLATAIDLEKV
jgi:hypothetical protein